MDIRVEAPAEANFELLKQISSSISQTYPKVKEIRRAQATIQIKPGSQIQATDPEDHLYQLVHISEDERQILRVGPYNFIFSRLKPYETWKKFEAEAKQLWEVYCRNVAPGSVTRIALRYVNRLELPVPVRDFRDYLTAPPDIPPRLPQTFSSFFTQMTMPISILGSGNAVVTQSLENVSEKKVTVVLDIDVYKENHMLPDAKEVWMTIAKLRKLKNRIFFESITEKMERLCK